METSGLDIQEKELTIQGAYEIGATITYRDEGKKSPVVVIIMGTGKTDRDGNSFGFHSDLYKNLARAFAACGYVAVRYDKRGTHRSGGCFNKTGLSDLTNDVITVVRYMKALPYTDENKVVLCGHSEGAIIASLASEQEETAGLLLLCGAATCIKDGLYYQNTLLAQEIPTVKGLTGAILRKSFHLDKQKAMIDGVFRKAAETHKDTVRIKGGAISAKWLREHGSYQSEDFVNILKRYRKPVLAITGQADYQADWHNLKTLEQESHISCCAPKGMTHILRTCREEFSILNIKKLYRSQLKQPIDTVVLQIIQDWLSAVAADKAFFMQDFEMEAL